MNHLISLDIKLINLIILIFIYFPTNIFTRKLYNINKQTVVGRFQTTGCVKARVHNTINIIIVNYTISKLSVFSKKSIVSFKIRNNNKKKKICICGL